MSSPRAYLLTWTCYGTWLPGDPRGSVDTRHNTPGQMTAPPNDWRRNANALRLANSPVKLDFPQRSIVTHAITDHCSLRRWTLHGLNVRTNHVHVVVSRGAYHPDVARDQFKSWSTRRLREAGYFSKPIVVWTEDGSSRYLWNTGDVRDAVRYIVEFQGDDI